MGYTDGLPVIPPTPDRVAAMVAGVGRSPKDVIATLPPGQGEATVEKIAVNAVMAGCRPEYMPVIIAAVEAVARPSFNLGVCQVTTHPASPMMLLNGPVRKDLSVNSGTNALGQGWRANATIGRALRLVLVNLGGAEPETVDKATQGQPGKYTFCFGENEEESPWEPLHVEGGFRPDESAVTVVAAGATHHLLNGGNDGEDVLKTVTYGIISAATNHVVLPEGEPLLLLCPAHANNLSLAGYTKEKLKRHLFEYARVPVEWLSNYCIARREHGGVATPKKGAIPMAETWENFMVAVVGGHGGLHSTFVTTVGPSRAQTRLVPHPAST